MARLRFIVLFIILTGCANISSSPSPSTTQLTNKKLIEYGWDVPTVSFIHDHITEMQKRPFDGVAFKLTGEDDSPSSAFDSRRWNEAEIGFDSLDQIQWGSLDSSFIVLWASNPVAMDWFDDARWNVIVENMRLFSKALKLSRVKGVFFDPEFYSVRETHSLWWYTSDIYPTMNKTQVEAKARQRGAQFMTALQSETDHFDFLSFYFLSESVRMNEGSSQANDYTHFELLPAFIYGMMDAAKPDVQFIDGNEPSYYFTQAVQYSNAKEFVKQQTLTFVPDNLQTSYQRVHVANALYLDYYMALRPEHDRGLPWEDRLKWLKHNLYYSLQESDEYVWLYSEHADWWKNDISPDIEAAIQESRQKINDQQPLGFEIHIPQ
jgi:hypothetical protein